MKASLQSRNERKAKKPDFERCQSDYRGSFAGVWRKARGKTNKQRRGKRGHKRVPRVGYGSPSDVYGVTRLGFRPVVINCVRDLEIVGDGDIAVLGGRVGERKRIILLEEIRKRGCKIFNVKDAGAYIESVEKNIEERGKKSKSRKEKKSKAGEEAEKKKKEDDEKKSGGEDKSKESKK